MEARYNNKLALKVRATCLPLKDEKIPLSAFANGTSEVAGLFFTLSLEC